MCGARYRISNVNGEHRVEKVIIDDLSEATVESINNDPTLKPSDKVSAYESLIKRTRQARNSYDIAYGKLIYLAEGKRDEWHKLASEQVVKVMSTKADCSAAQLVCKVAMAYTGGGQSLIVDDRPWDPERMTDPIYLRRVAEKLSVAHILE